MRRQPNIIHLALMRCATRLARRRAMAGSAAVDAAPCVVWSSSTGPSGLNERARKATAGTACHDRGRRRATSLRRCHALQCGGPVRTRGRPGQGCLRVADSAGGSGRIVRFANFAWRPAKLQCRTTVPHRSTGRQCSLVPDAAAQAALYLDQFWARSFLPYVRHFNRHLVVDDARALPEPFSKAQPA
jgi:hypothetical protein